jgi:DNA-binding PadR family transcriptional regulator
VIELAILGVLKGHEAYSYELKKRMAQLAGGSAASRSVPYWPALNRLELASAVRTIDQGGIHR